MPELEYSCFLHPKRKSSQYPEACPDCGFPYTFPLDNPPQEINALRVIKPLNRGFYGATYVVEHPRTKRKHTMKIIPIKTYSADEGYDKSFDDEITGHAMAIDSKINVLPNLLNAGEISVEFNVGTIECHFILMDYIDGITLKEFKKSTELTASRITQIAYDLFDFLRKMENIGLHHNDLHDGNILIEITDGKNARVDSIDRTIKAYVIDMGSMSGNDRSGEYCRDITWILRHIDDMVEFCWEKATPKEQRILSRLIGLAKTCFAKESVREHTYDDYCVQIHNAFKEGENPLAYPKRLITPADYYNTQLMPIHYAPNLFYDPENKWTKNLLKPGTVLLTGMRGCGKTILLKSLHFFASVQEKDGENKNQRLKRLGEENYIGLFVSCSTLLTDPKSKELHLPNQKLILAFSVDAIKCIKYCENESIGKLDYSSIEYLCEVLKELIPWFEKPSNCYDLTSVELKIETALLKARKINSEEAGDLNVHEAFNILANRIKNCIDFWNNKHVIYLLDDLSARYLKQDNVDELLSQLNYQNENFSFKVSTETPTLKLRTGAGEISRLDRDYEDFDLGNEVMQILKDDSEFMENVLKKRLELINKYNDVSPSNILGSQSYAKIAESLAEKNSKNRGSYWGIKALGALSTGDIGDSVLMFHHMLEHIDSKTMSVSHEMQDKVIFDFSERKLRSLANQKKWLYDHAVSFAQASQLELKKSYDEHLTNPHKKIRQYNEIFLRIDPEETVNVFEKINELVEGGVFVFAGGTPRSKMPGSKSSLFLKLAYRKILGVTNLMPISFRDRFELSGENLTDWLENPTADKLRKTVGTTIIVEDSDTIDEIENWDWSDYDEDGSKVEIKSAASIQARLGHYSKEEIDTTSEIPVLPFTIESKPLSKLCDIDINGKHIIGALGFEDRSKGTWENILSVGNPSSVTLVLYEDDEGYKEAIIELLNERNIRFNVVSYTHILPFDGAFIDKDAVKVFVEKLPNKEIVLDITSMNKPLIFLLTSEILKQKNNLGILHTSAEVYLPAESDLEKVMGLLDKNAPVFFEEADKLIPGEFDPQSKMTIWQNRDPGTTVYLICFISLKYSRVKKLLEELPVDFIDVVYPLSLDGEKSARSRFAGEIADILRGETGKTWPTLSNDHLEAFKVISSLYSKYALQYGVNVEIGLTGVKMHTVAAGMLASFVNFSGVYYTPIKFDKSQYTKGTGETTFTILKMKKFS